MTLEETFRKIAAEHDLMTVSLLLQVSGVSDDYRFGATVHWDGYSRSDITCEHGFGPSLEAALNNALDKSRADRAAPAPSLAEVDASSLIAA